MKMGKFLNRIDLAAAVWRQDVQNSQVKRGVLDLSDSVRESQVICGCGNQVAVSFRTGRE
jgi:hypothetical protein